LLSLLATVTGLYEALNATSGADANAMTMMSAFFLVICIVLSMFYFAMDPNEKYKYV
jgi:biopolymer transport protein ExbB/TolQ